MIFKGLLELEPNLNYKAKNKLKQTNTKKKITQREVEKEKTKD